MPAVIEHLAIDSPLGPILLAGSERGLARVGLPNDDPDQIVEELALAYGAEAAEGGELVERAADRFERYFDAGLREFGLPLDLGGLKGFRREVLEAVHRIPYGQTRSYGEVAEDAGRPRAFRAAGTACGVNPLPIVIPCHRVLHADGGIGGYGPGGTGMKRALLELERAELERAGPEQVGPERTGLKRSG